MPAVMPAVVTLSVMVPAPVPDVGLRLSQLALSVAAQLSVPLPELTTETVLMAGLLPLWMPEKDTLVVLKPIVGVGAAVMSKLTETD